MKLRARPVANHGHRGISRRQRTLRRPSTLVLRIRKMNWKFAGAMKSACASMGRKAATCQTPSNRAWHGNWRASRGGNTANGAALKASTPQLAVTAAQRRSNATAQRNGTHHGTERQTCGSNRADFSSFPGLDIAILVKAAIPRKDYPHITMALVCVFDGLGEVLEYVSKVAIVNKAITAGGDFVLEPAGLVEIETVGSGLLFTANTMSPAQGAAVKSLGILAGGMVLFPGIAEAEARGAKVTKLIRAAGEPATPATLDTLVREAAALNSEEVPEDWSALVKQVQEQMEAFIASGAVCVRRDVPLPCLLCLPWFFVGAGGAVCPRYALNYMHMWLWHGNCALLARYFLAACAVSCSSVLTSLLLPVFLVRCRPGCDSGWWPRPQPRRRPMRWSWSRRCRGGRPRALARRPRALSR